MHAAYLAGYDGLMVPQEVTEGTDTFTEAGGPLPSQSESAVCGCLGF